MVGEKVSRLVVEKGSNDDEERISGNIVINASTSRRSSRRVVLNLTSCLSRQSRLFLLIFFVFSSLVVASSGERFRLVDDLRIAATRSPNIIDRLSIPADFDRSINRTTAAPPSDDSRNTKSVLFRPRLRFDPSKDPMWTNRLIFAALYGVLFLLGLANVLVLFIVSRYRRMRTVTNILIFNLCLADLVYISFLPIVIMFQLLRDWMFGVAVCKLFYIAESTAKYASVYFVSILSFDRYLAMCHPHWCKRYRHPTLAITVSAIGWFVTAALMIPIYLYSTVVGQEGSRFCTVSWPPSTSSKLATASENLESFVDWHNASSNFDDFNHSDYYRNQSWNEESFYNQSIDRLAASRQTPYKAPPGQFYFVTLTFIFCFGMPALVILFFYFKVVDQLMQASNRAERLKKKREKTYRKVTRMVLAVITCYILCWMPYWIQFLVVTFVTHISLNDGLRIFFNSIHLLPYLNCALNPILYSLMTENFRRILIELFPCSHCGSCSKCQQRKKDNRNKDAPRRLIVAKSPSQCRRRSIAYDLEQLQNGGGGLLAAAKGAISGGGKRNRSASCAHSPYDMIDEDEFEFDSRRLMYTRPSISQSIRLVSDFSLNLLSTRSVTSNTANSSETIL